MRTGEWENRSKRDQVRAFLIRELRSGKYAPGTMFFSENEVIRTFGFCKNTVREAFSSLVSDGMLERIRGKGTFVREAGARSGAGSSAAKVVHLIVGDPMGKNQDDPFVGQVLQGVHRALDRHGWLIRLHLISPVASVIDSVRDLLPEIGSGEWAMLAGFDYPKAVTDSLIRAGVRVATVGRPEDASVPFVDCNPGSETAKAVEFLAARGHRRIALADRRISHVPSFEGRREGFLRALSAHGLVPDARLMVEYRKFDLDAGAEVWGKLRTYPVDFTALICYGDWASYGVIQCAAREGIRVPEDFSLVSICGSPLRTAELLIDRIGPPELAENCGLLLLELENGGERREIILDSSMVPGNSVRSLTPVEPAVSGGKA